VQLEVLDPCLQTTAVRASCPVASSRYWAVGHAVIIRHLSIISNNRGTTGNVLLLLETCCSASPLAVVAVAAAVGVAAAAAAAAVACAVDGAACLEWGLRVLRVLVVPKDQVSERLD
jgi:hypothetical protein